MNRHVLYRGSVGLLLSLAVSLAVPAVSEAAAGSWGEGDRDPAIAAIQEKLKTLGYLSGAADGVFGADTSRAVIAFQKAAGLTADGKVGNDTLYAINYQAAEKQQSAAQPATHYRGSSWGEGDSDPAIADIQRKLIALGYLHGTADGVFGSDTSDAVLRFQKAAGLTADGKVGNDTLYAINHEAGAKSQPAPSTSTTHYRGSSWGEGDSDPAIADIQARLRVLGYLSGAADGVFGNDTSEAVKHFQKDYGLTADGKVGNDTLYALNHARPAKQEAAAPAESSHAGSWGEGDRGNDIETIQEKLKRLGYLQGSADGVFGDDTSHAVMAFQRDAGLDVDGKVGNATLSALDSYTPRPRRTGNRMGGTLSLGDSGDQVVRLQNKLLLHGYNPGTVDGVYGESTAEAVRELQAEENLARTGAADGDVWDRLSDAPRFTGNYKRVFHMRATAYTPNDGGGGGHTALGGFAGKGHAAVDPNVIPLGSVVYIEGYGYAICDDIGGAIHGNIIDVGVDTLDQAYEWGTRSRVNVYLIR